MNARFRDVLLVAMVTALLSMVVSACGHQSTHTVTRTITKTATTPTTTTVTTPTVETLTQACPIGKAYMGCSTGASPTFSTTPPTTLGLTLSPTGTKFPDVSNWQGCSLNWADIDASGAAIKLGESDDIVDSCAAHNIASLRAAKKKVIVYWFVRPVDKTAQAAYIVKELKAEKLTINHIVIYTSEGTWTGATTGGYKLWDATYGPAILLPSGFVSSSVAAWQYTDEGYVKGLGYGDLSVSYGLLSYAPHVLVLDMEVAGLSGYAPALANYVLKHDPVVASSKPKPTTAKAIVVGKYTKKPTARKYYLIRGLGHGWWEYVPTRHARTGAILTGPAHKVSLKAKSGYHLIGLGDGWWEYVRN